MNHGKNIQMINHWIKLNGHAKLFCDRYTNHFACYYRLCEYWLYWHIVFVQQIVAIKFRCASVCVCVLCTQTKKVFFFYFGFTRFKYVLVYFSVWWKFNLNRFPNDDVPWKISIHSYRKPYIRANTLESINDFDII